MPIITQSILFVYAHCVVLTYYVKRFRVILLYLALYKCYNNNNNICVVLKQRMYINHIFCIENKLDILSLWTRYVKHFTSISYARECVYDLLHVKRRIIKSLTIQCIPIHMKSGLPLFPLLCSTSAKYALAEIKLLDLTFQYTAKRQKLRNHFCFLSN